MAGSDQAFTTQRDRLAKRSRMVMHVYVRLPRLADVQWGAANDVPA